MPDAKRIYARFTGPEIFLEQGRLLYSLLHVFVREGYRIDLFDWLGEKPLEKYGQMIHGLDSLRLVHAAPADPAQQWYLYDRTVPELAALPWRKRLQVRFDLFSPFWRENPIIMPFPMHPMQSGLTGEDLVALRQSERRMRVFFSGDTEHYRRVWIRYPRTKLPRERIVQAAIGGLGEEAVLVHDAAELAERLAQGYTQKCVFTASSQVRIEFADWLPTLAKADFFLSPPGIVMPMCHNIIEAMAVGTIPITNYPEWLDPPLRHGRECLAFDDEADLVAQLRLALTMDPALIEALRRGVIDYYERHLRPDGFVRRVEASTEAVQPILMYTERNVALHAKRLGRTSLLVQGTNRPQGVVQRWLAAWRNDVESRVRG
jgi:hypothetical protein